MNTAKKYRQPQQKAGVVICPFPRPSLADLLADGMPMPVGDLEKELAYVELKTMRWRMEQQGYRFTERYEDFIRRIADELGV